MSNRKKIRRPQPTLLFKPGAYILRIEHDDRCGYWKHKRPNECTCTPNHTVIPVGDTATLN